jgi:hypothetical protein
VEWANNVVNFTPGLQQITLTGSYANFGTASNALGPSDAIYNDPDQVDHVVSLGDGGSMTLSFAQPITNGPGTDFAVYENGFQVSGNQYFLELATVSVSSDGIHFFTFPSVSLTQTTTQVGGNGTLDPSDLYNLAGSQPAGWGTAFDLSDLSTINSPYLNLYDITEVRVTDVIGNIDTSLTSPTGSLTYTYDDASNPIFNGAYGTSNNLINDPYATDFPSSGFDLDAIGVINAVPEPSPVLFLGLGLSALVLVLGASRWRRSGD